jgi:hypothetical protein
MKLTAMQCKELDQMVAGNLDKVAFANQAGLAIAVDAYVGNKYPQIELCMSTWGTDNLIIEIEREED